MLQRADITLSRLINRPRYGETEGVCYACGEHTLAGHRRVPSSSFTAWAQVYVGDVICEYCITLFSDRSYRFCSWLATTDRVSFAESKGQIREWLLEPPEPPYALYLTRGRQKQGWLSLMRYVSHSREQYYIGTDWLDRPLLVIRAQLPPLMELATALRQHKVSKAELQSGNYTAPTWRRALEEGWTEMLKQAQEQIGNPIWEVIIYATD